jgi:hypothetical protein
MALRRAHGIGAAALARVETLPLDEHRAPNAADTERGLALRAARGRPFQKGNKAAAARKPTIASVAGIPVHSDDEGYRRLLRWARAYRNHRVRELSVQYGGDLSAGVCGILTSAAQALAMSRFLAEYTAKKGISLKVAAVATKLAMDARQMELTAMEMAEREVAARPRGPVDPMAHIRAMAEGRR